MNTPIITNDTVRVIPRENQNFTPFIGRVIMVEEGIYSVEDGKGDIWGNLQTEQVSLVDPIEEPNEWNSWHGDSDGTVGVD